MKILLHLMCTEICMVLILGKDVHLQEQQFSCYFLETWMTVSGHAANDRLSLCYIDPFFSRYFM